MSSIPLEELIKNNLANYEARYDSNDWTRMETLLGTTPDSRPFNWKPVLIGIIVLGLIGGGYALFTTLDFSPTKKSTPYVPPKVVKKTPVTPPKKTVTPLPAPVVNTDSIKQAEEAAAVAALAAKEEEERIQREETEKEEARLKKERRREKEKEELTKEEIELRRARRRAIATTDSGKTNEEAKEVKTPEKKTAVGLNIFSTMHADSLKKYQEKLKKDSVK